MHTTLFPKKCHQSCAIRFSPERLGIDLCLIYQPCWPRCLLSNAPTFFWKFLAGMFRHFADENVKKVSKVRISRIWRCHSTATPNSQYLIRCAPAWRDHLNWLRQTWMKSPRDTCFGMQRSLSFDFFSVFFLFPPLLRLEIEG